MDKFQELIKISDQLDSLGLTKEADILDDHLIKLSKQGIHKCGLKEESVNHHLKLLDSYQKAKQHLDLEYKKALKSSNEKDSPNYGKLRELFDHYAYNVNAINLHEMYLSDVINNNPYALEKDSQMKELLKELYGSEAEFQHEIQRLIQIPRNGWVIFGYCVFSKKLSFSVIDLHDQHIPLGFIPVLALDVWEHAYLLDFGASKEDYLKWFLGRIDWRNVRKRIKIVQKIK